jgi:hypothetical protein
VCFFEWPVEYTHGLSTRHKATGDMNRPHRPRRKNVMRQQVIVKLENLTILGRQRLRFSISYLHHHLLLFVWLTSHNHV